MIIYLMIGLVGVAGLASAPSWRDDSKERDCWLWHRCYACGHRLRFASTVCPQCGEEFDGRRQPRKGQWPERCDCDRCVLARDPTAQ